MVLLGLNMIHSVTSRLQSTPMLPELRQCLEDCAAQDEPFLHRASFAERIFLPIAAALDTAKAQVVLPLATAWAIFVAAALRLDDIQDGDGRVPDQSSDPSSAIRCHVLLTYYVLATAILDDLDPTVFGPERLLLLRRFWSDCTLRIASGQYRDLLVHSQHLDRSLAVLDQYQEVAQAKTGAFYGLAFGATAVVMTGDQRVVDALTHAGEIYGTLIQFTDDLVDEATQIHPVLTLPRVFQTASDIHGVVHSPLSPHAFWRHVYPTYRAAAEEALAALPVPLREAVLRIFHDTFVNNA